MISSVCWVPRGASKFKPDFSEPTEEEVEAIRARAESQVSTINELNDELELEEDEWDEMEDGDEEDEFDIEDGEEKEDNESAVEKARAMAKAIGNIKTTSTNIDDDAIADELAELDMDHYDDEKDDQIRLFSNGGSGASYYKNNDEDPYIVLKDEEDEEEIENLTIKETDLLILTARNEDDVSHLEVWVCEEDAESAEELNMYVHHDIILSAFPLSLAWLDFGMGEDAKGNLVAVGTMQPEIEIWDLDTMDAVEPLIVLGGTLPQNNENNSEKKTKKKKSKPKYKEGSHTDSVLSLSWNSEYRNVICSGSADKSIKIWDISAQVCQHTMTHHTDKVQSVVWNPKEPTVLLSGSFDKTVALCDMRFPSKEAIKWSVSSDVECLNWNIHDPFYFMVSTEDGLIRCFDVRKGQSQNANEKKDKSSTSADNMQSVFTLQAHDKATCSISFNTVIPNLLATASTDKVVKLWDIANNTPVCVATKNPKIGAIFSISFCADSPYLLAMGGSKGVLDVWNVSEDSSIAQRFHIRS